MNALARIIDEFINEREPGERPEFGFTLLVFTLGPDPDGTHRMNYISNAQKDDMITAMKEFIASVEGRKALDVGHA